MITRQKPIPKKRKKARRGRVADKAYLDWLATQPCLITGQRPVTIHHVRRFGEPKDDRRTVPLIPEMHFIQFSPSSVEALGKTKFEKLHGVSLEGAIVTYNQLYESMYG